MRVSTADPDGVSGQGIQQAPADRRPARWLPLAALILYVGLLSAAGATFRLWGVPPTAAWNPTKPTWLIDWAGRLVMAGFIELVRFAPVGLLAVLAVARVAPRRGRLARAVLALILAVGLLLAVCSVDGGWWSRPWRLVLPVTGDLVGLWVGVAWTGGRRARRWLVAELAVPLLLLAGAATWLWCGALERQPLRFPPTRVTSADQRHLVDLVRRSRPGGTRQGTLEELRLTGHDVNLLVAWWLHVDRPDRKARAWLADGTITVQATLAASPLRGAGGYVNLRGTAQLAIAGGDLLLDIQQLRVGRIQLPVVLLQLLNGVLRSAIEDDPNLKEVLGCIHSLRVRTDGLDVVANTELFRTRVVPLLLARRAIPANVRAATQAQIVHLVSRADALPDRDWDPRLLALLQTAFATAQERSRVRDPVVENQAAILALAILSGDRRIETLVGPVIRGAVPRRAHRRLTWASLRGRIDWSKHFVIAGALALLADKTSIEAIGLFKEKLDSAAGGSGFSFADLMADRAGRSFALAATRDAQSARAMQARLTGALVLEDFFPPAADLPECLSAEQLTARYGGIGGAGYRAVEREIDRRLARCAALE